jgi:hypothetical protein
MKILINIKKSSLLLGFLFVVSIIRIIYAADYYQINSGAQVTIDEHSVCKKVTNNNALAIFVPTKISDEWLLFRTYASGVTYADCLYCQDADGDGYGICPNCGIAAGCTYDGNDCCDSDSRAKPGQTTYYTSANNCGSWDYDCNGTISKSDCNVRSASLSTSQTQYRAGCLSKIRTIYRNCSTGTISTLSCGSSGYYYSCIGSSGYCKTGTCSSCTGYYRGITSRSCACR